MYALSPYMMSDHIWLSQHEIPSMSLLLCWCFCSFKFYWTLIIIWTFSSSFNLTHVQPFIHWFIATLIDSFIHSFSHSSLVDTFIQTGLPSSVTSGPVSHCVVCCETNLFLTAFMLACLLNHDITTPLSYHHNVNCAVSKITVIK